MRASLVLLLAACGAHPPPTSAPKIEVLEAGAEPRRVIRYDLHAGTSLAETTVKARTDIAFTNTVLETGHRLVDMPTLTFRGRFDVTAPTSIVSTLDHVWVGDDALDAAQRARLAGMLDRLAGVRTTLQVTPAGEVLAAHVDAPEVPAAARDQLDDMRDSQVAVVFPDASIGVGATWRATVRARLGHITWQRAITYRLRELTDDSARVDFEVAMRASEQALGVEPNASTHLTSGTGTGRGEMLVSLHTPVVTGTQEMTLETNLQIVRGHLRIAATGRTETLVSTRPIP